MGLKKTVTILMVALSQFCAVRNAACEEISLPLKTGWNLVSFWFSTDSLVTDINAAGLEIYASTPSGGGVTYGKVTSVSEIERGASYWIKSEYGEPLTLNGDKYPATSDFTKTLAKGWNLVGNPFPGDISQGNIIVGGTQASQGPAELGGQKPIYYEAGGFKEADGPLRVGEGFFVWAETSTASMVFAPPEQELVADAGNDVRCIMGEYYTSTWNGTQNEYTANNNTCTLDGSGSFAPSGGTLTYSWERVSGPEVSLTTPNETSTEFEPPSEGNYAFMLTVSDGVSTATDSVVIHAKKIQGKIVFNSALSQKSGDKHSVFTINADGTDLNQITEYSAEELMPRWSPDGQQITFASDRDGDWEIYVVGTSGTNLIQLTDNNAIDSAPTWCLDGNIVYTSDRNGYWELYDMNTSSTGTVVLTDIKKWYLRPRCSFDGTKIAFWANYGGDNWDIHVMDRDGINLVRLTEDIPLQTDVAWTTDGRILYVQEETLLADGKLFVVNSDGTGKKEWTVPAAATDIDFPDMTDDGEYIFYINKGDGDYIHAMCSDGTCDARIGYKTRALDYHP